MEIETIMEKINTFFGKKQLTDLDKYLIGQRIVKESEDAALFGETEDDDFEDDDLEEELPEEEPETDDQEQEEEPQEEEEQQEEEYDDEQEEEPEPQPQRQEVRKPEPRGTPQQPKFKELPKPVVAKRPPALNKTPVDDWLADM